ncbi:predicted protein [Streptomyces albidoflavus]|nr:predicted protein [Streptomyces albidoflavus]
MKKPLVTPFAPFVVQIHAVSLEQLMVIAHTHQGELS